MQRQVPPVQGPRCCRFSCDDTTTGARRTRKHPLIDRAHQARGYVSLHARAYVSGGGHNAATKHVLWQIVGSILTEKCGRTMARSENRYIM